MEPGARVPGVCYVLHSRFPARAPVRTPPPATRSRWSNGREIRGDEFRRTYQAQLQAYRSAYGGNMSEQLLKQLGIDQQILQQMVDERAALAEADRARHQGQRRGSRAADLRDSGVPGERRVHRRAALPAAARASQRPPLTPSEFEDKRPPLARGREAARVAHRLAVGVRQGARAGIPAAQRQGEAGGGQLQRRQLPPRRRPRPTPTSRSYFEAHTGRLQDSREAQGQVPARSTSTRCARRSTVPPADIERAYNDNIEQYTTPEQVRASHILLQDRRQGRRGGEGARPKTC